MCMALMHGLMWWAWLQSVPANDAVVLALTEAFLLAFRQWRQIGIKWRADLRHVTNASTLLKVGRDTGSIHSHPKRP